jgi:signal transduction histidine kinase
MSIKLMVLNVERLLSSSQADHPGRYGRLAWLVLTAALVALLVLWSVSTGAGFSGRGGAQASVQLREAMFTELGPSDVAGNQPPSAVEGASVRLPHRLEPGELRDVNYRIALELPLVSAPSVPLALCVPRWSSSATVWLNGQLLRQPAPGTAGLLDAQRPELITLPPGLGAGRHVLDIRLRAVPGAISGLSPVWLGDSTHVRDGCWALHEGQRDSNVGNAYIMGFMGLIALAIGVVKRDRMALYFALLAAAWCSHHLFVLGNWTSMDESTWLTIFYATRPLAVLPLALFVLTYIGQPKPWLQWSLLLLFGVAYSTLAVLPDRYQPLWIAVFGLILLLVMLVLFVWLVRYSMQHAAISVVIFCVALVLAITFNMLDVARALEWLPWVDRSFSFLAVPSLALGMGTLVLERLVRYMGTEERSAVALREEVARQRAQMAEDYREIKAQNEKIAVLEERKRIVRDMHDGLGTQLVSASALLRSSPGTSAPLSAVIDGALHELRSVLDVLSAVADIDDPDDDPVSLLLGKLRHRLGPVFRAQGIEFGWHTEPLPHDFLVGDQTRLQLLRVLQEAFANVLKHSQARNVQLSTQVFNDRIVVELRDDGMGFDASALDDGQPAGHGLDSMRQRAQEMGAVLKISRLFPGTSVRMTFPWSSPGDLTSPADGP